MKNIRFDQDGTPRCWKCGSKAFTEKRTFRSKAAIGVGALLTKKKLKCQRCGEYNDTGNGQTYDGPQSRKYRKEWEAEKAEIAARSTPMPLPPPPGGTADELAKLAALRDQGVLTNEEFAAQKARLIG